MRAQIRHVRVALTSPIRLYLRRVPFGRGKGFIMRRVLRPMLPPPPASFVAVRPDGSQVSLYYRETLGVSEITFGHFEEAECRALCEFARPGGVAFDVGANVGVMTVPLARAVGPHGFVIAVEPLAENVRRLRANAALNGLANIDVRMVAAGRREGHVDFTVAEDAGWGSLRSLSPGMRTASVITVESQPLDSIWSGLDRPIVSVMKVDVEGAEAGVIEGASELLKRDHPVLILEASGASALEVLVDLLRPYGYAEAPSPGFMPWNHLFAVMERAR